MTGVSILAPSAAAGCLGLVFAKIAWRKCQPWFPTNPDMLRRLPSYKRWEAATKMSLQPVNGNPPQTYLDRISLTPKAIPYDGRPGHEKILDFAKDIFVPREIPDFVYDQNAYWNVFARNHALTTCLASLPKPFAWLPHAILENCDPGRRSILIPLPLIEDRSTTSVPNGIYRSFVATHLSRLQPALGVFSNQKIRCNNPACKCIKQQAHFHDGYGFHAERHTAIKQRHNNLQDALKVCFRFVGKRIISEAFIRDPELHAIRSFSTDVNHPLYAYTLPNGKEPLKADLIVIRNSTIHIIEVVTKATRS